MKRSRIQERNGNLCEIVTAPPPPPPAAAAPAPITTTTTMVIQCVRSFWLFQEPWCLKLFANNLLENIIKTYWCTQHTSQRTSGDKVFWHTLLFLLIEEASQRLSLCRSTNNTFNGGWRPAIKQLICVQALFGSLRNLHSHHHPSFESAKEALCVSWLAKGLCSLEQCLTAVSCLTGRKAVSLRGSQLVTMKPSVVSSHHVTRRRQSHPWAKHNSPLLSASFMVWGPVPIRSHRQIDFLSTPWRF